MTTKEGVGLASGCENNVFISLPRYRFSVLREPESKQENSNPWPGAGKIYVEAYAVLKSIVSGVNI